MHSNRKNFWVFKENFVFEYFWLEFEQKNCHFRNQYRQIFQYAKFHAKIKTTYIYNKKYFIWIFSGWNSKKPLSYLKLNPLEILPSNLFNCKVWWKKKILKFRNKNAQFVYFGAIIWKYYCHIWNPRICLAGLGFENNIIIFEISTL